MKRAFSIPLSKHVDNLTSKVASLSKAPVEKPFVVSNRMMAILLLSKLRLRRKKMPKIGTPWCVLLLLGLAAPAHAQSS